VNLLVARLSNARAVAWWFGGAPPDDPLGPIEQDVDAVRDEACKVVSENQSSCSPPKPTPTPTSRTGGGFDLSLLSLLLWVLLIAAVLLLVAVIANRVGGRSSRAKHARDTAADDLPEDDVEERVVAIDRSREPFDWRAEADEHRRAGRFREALRCRYRALVGDLARRGVIDEIPGRTTGEHRLQMHEVRPAVAPLFDEAAELFDGAWYGHYDVDEHDDDRFVVLAGQVMNAAEARR